MFSSEWGGREGDCISQALRAVTSVVGPGYSGAPCRRTYCGVFRQRGSCHPTGVSWRQEAGRGEGSKDGLSVKPGFMQQVCFSKGSGFEAFGVQQAGCKRKEGQRHPILSALDSSFFPSFLFHTPSALPCLRGYPLTSIGSIPRFPLLWPLRSLDIRGTSRRAEGMRRGRQTFSLAPPCSGLWGQAGYPSPDTHTCYPHAARLC